MKLNLRMNKLCSTDCCLVQWDFVKFLAPFLALLVSYLTDGTVSKEFLGWFFSIYLPWAFALTIYIVRRNYLKRQNDANKQAEIASLVSSVNKNGVKIDKDQMSTLLTANNEAKKALNSTCTQLSSLEDAIKENTLAKQAETVALQANTEAKESNTKATKAQTKVTFELVSELKKANQKQKNETTLHRLSALF